MCIRDSLDPDRLPAPLVGIGVTADQIDRWQAQTWMLVCVPGMQLSDARVLVASGIQEPEQLDTTPYDQLVSRVSRYLQSSNGQRDYPNYQFDRTRVDRWYDALRSTRSNWRRDTGYSRRYRRGQRSRQSHSHRSASSQFQNDNHNDGRSNRDGAIREYEAHTRLRAVSERSESERSKSERQPRERRKARESRTERKAKVTSLSLIHI